MNANTCTYRDLEGITSEQVLLEIRRRLCATGHPVLRGIECEYSDGVVVLRGRVPTYYLKQVAQAALLFDPIVRRIVNLIDVSQNGHPMVRPR